MMRRITFAAMLLIAGCATPVATMEEAASRQNWASAYESMQHELRSGTPQSLERALALVRSYPAVLQYGSATFDREALKKYADYYGEVELHKIRLKHFCIVASPEQCRLASAELAWAEKNVRPLTLVLKEFYEQLSAAEMQRLNERKRLRLVPSSEVGIVTDRQSQDVSVAGSSAGSQLGSAVGSAAYVDKAFSGSTPGGYSAMGHLNAQLAGALIGGVLGNREAQQRFRIQYTIRYRGGRVAYEETVSNSPLGHSVGVCVRTTDFSLLDQSLCEGTFEAFRKTLDE